MKKKFREMHEQMRQEQFQGHDQQAAQKSPTVASGEDYIDFEEIK